MQRREVICRNGVPTHPSGAAAYLATAHLSCPTNQEMACWLLFPPPAFLFNFWADLPKNFKDLRNPPSLNDFQERPKVARAFKSQGPAGNSEGPPETLPSQGLGSFAASGRSMASGRPARPAEDQEAQAVGVRVSYTCEWQKKKATAPDGSSCSKAAEYSSGSRHPRKELVRPEHAWVGLRMAEGLE